MDKDRMLDQAADLLRAVAIANREWWELSELWLMEYEASQRTVDVVPRTDEPCLDADEAAQHETLSGG